MLGLKQDGAGMLETGRGSGCTAREWAGRSKVGCGLWVCVPEGWSKAPRQGEAAAVVRLVWQRWVSSSSCVWWPGLLFLAHGPP